MTASEIAAELKCPSFLPERKYCVYRAAIATFYVPSCGCQKLQVCGHAARFCPEVEPIEKSEQTNQGLSVLRW
jgi:hypothetical protein